ncbi:helix-turn-helix domain-containing protein [Vibrio nigripulchritudo]|uniref:helix-turn-helix domain-containing protein n=1 Tax=Vibrio nigripulchritudo TaxID=28173 RepID=UPI002493C586|nr:XRE family transcriptional regulator [Vibrio nigripulchritudo]BDU41061.1 repressor protein [Vibrio nigripulchritudo]BDU46801.1 repressor protein [Vibrio nigripulchritudo]
MSELGKRLEDLRLGQGLTQEQMGRIAGVTGVTVGKWERGDAVPRDEKLKAVAAHFRVSFEYLRVGFDQTALLSATQQEVVAIPSYRSGEDTLIYDARLLPQQRSHHLVYLAIEGGNMGDVFPVGSRVVVDTDDLHLKEGQFYALELNEFLTIRKVFYTTNGVSLEMPGNTQHSESITFPEMNRITVIGRVVAGASPR